MRWVLRVSSWEFSVPERIVMGLMLAGLLWITFQSGSQKVSEDDRLFVRLMLLGAGVSITLQLITRILSR